MKTKIQNGGVNVEYKDKDDENAGTEVIVKKKVRLKPRGRMQVRHALT